MNPRAFLKLGNVYTKSSMSAYNSTAVRRFISFFGVTPLACCKIWDQLKYELPLGADPKHLLWCLSFLKENSNEHYRRSVFNADEKTMRKWTWTFVTLLANMNVILWEKRFEGRVHGQTCFCSLDGVDCEIFEPKPFSPAWYSHKFHGSGLRYEVGLNIRTGHIVWSHGGYPCGLFPDLKLAREAYVLSVSEGERTMADKGYNDPTYFILKNTQNHDLHSFIMSRHETVNKRMKQFKILSNYRYSLEKHPIIFLAVANLTQLMIENGFPLFSVA